MMNLLKDMAVSVSDLDEAMIVEALRVTYGGQIVAKDISEVDYLEHYAEHFCEWVNGVVIKMSPVSSRHDDLFQFLIFLLGHYLAIVRVGKMKLSPFVLRMDAVGARREPDIQIVLKEHLDRLKPTYVDIAADICIEIVSLGTVEVDYGKKFKEYEEAGVGEYWILDILRYDALFYRRNEQGIFQRHSEDAEGNYITPLLPRFKLHVPTLWSDPLPDASEAVALVKAMLANQAE